jgi:glutaminyl-peptide cyclotransferase
MRSGLRSLAMAGNGDPSGGGSGGRVRLLVVVLVVQLVAAALIIFVIAGWPWVDRAPASPARAAAVPERFLPGSPGDSVPTPTVDRFDSSYAFSLLRRQVERYGWRPAGSPALRRLATDLRRRLPGGRLEALGARHRGLRNVTGVIPGRRPAILVAAHYDVEARPRGFVGANDGAAGTAAVVGIARALAASPVRGGREVKFALFDGEEEPAGSADHYRDGLRGSRAYLRRHPGEVGELVLLDYVGARGLRLPREGSSDRQLWTRLRAAAGRVGVAAAFPDETGATVYDDHTPFLLAGIPAINLIDWGYPWRDTLADDMSKVSPRSLDVSGEAVVELVDELRRR